MSPDQNQQYVGPDLGKIVCKTWMHDHGKNVCKHVCFGYRQTTLASKEFRQNCFLTMKKSFQLRSLQMRNCNGLQPNVFMTCPICI